MLGARSPRSIRATVAWLTPASVGQLPLAQLARLSLLTDGGAEQARRDEWMTSRRWWTTAGRAAKPLTADSTTASAGRAARRACD